ncbi:MAG: NADH:ubiquinone oxidoreductase [Fusobacteria bacterium]|nr:NADH:ubiquinone oxidoreductase [Fusobacteriota bacterium]
MKNLLINTVVHRKQAIKDNSKAVLHSKFIGLPMILKNRDPQDELCCEKLCLNGAILLSPFRIDLGKCSFCKRCSIAFPKLICFTSHHKLSATSREMLIIDDTCDNESYEKRAILPLKSKIFKRSLSLRSVCAGGNGACEAELNACFNVNFDAGRYGIKMVASPRHADGIIISGPITGNMAVALEKAFEATPNPKLIILLGCDAISGGVFANSKNLNRSFLDRNIPTLYIPGAPPHPQTIIHGIMKMLDRV